MDNIQMQKICDDFFNKEMNQKNLSEIEKMSLEEFEKYQQYFYKNLVDNVTIHLRNFIAEIRGDYSFDSDEQDPLDVKNMRGVVKKLHKIIDENVQKYFIKNLIVQKKNQELQALNMEKQRVREMTVEIEGQKYLAIDKIDVYWCGWESDTSAWLIEKDGAKKIVVSNHGQAMIADRDFLENKLEEYRKVMQDTQRFLDILES